MPVVPARIGRRAQELIATGLDPDAALAQAALEHTGHQQPAQPRGATATPTPVNTKARRPLKPLGRDLPVGDGSWAHPYPPPVIIELVRANPGMPEQPPRGDKRTGWDGLCWHWLAVSLFQQWGYLVASYPTTTLHGNFATHVIGDSGAPDLFIRGGPRAADLDVELKAITGRYTGHQAVWAAEIPAARYRLWTPADVDVICAELHP